MSSEDWEFTTEFTSIITEVGLFFFSRSLDRCFEVKLSVQSLTRILNNDLWSLVKGRMNYGRKSEHYALERHP